LRLLESGRLLEVLRYMITG